MPRVKAKRQYTSTLRKQQASQTRARILDTAQVLFTSRGYGATTMEAIASSRPRMHRFRYDNMRQFVSWLAAKGPLRAGISEEDAAAIVWTLAGPEVHGLLRRDRGWSQDRYVSWLSDTLARTLL